MDAEYGVWSEPDGKFVETRFDCVSDAEGMRWGAVIPEHLGRRSPLGRDYEIKDFTVRQVGRAYEITPSSYQTLAADRAALGVEKVCISIGSDFVMLAPEQATEFARAVIAIAESPV